MSLMTQQKETVAILDKAQGGLRISEEEAVHLFGHAELLDLGVAAHAVRSRLNHPQRVSYVIDRNVNYTNICSVHCSFCAFYRNGKDPDAYVLSDADLSRKVEETKMLGGTGFLLQGGVNPELSWDYYLNLLSYLNKTMKIWVHGFSPVEIQHLSKLSGQTLQKTLLDLKEAGLGSLPGGGAEILVDRVRKKISPRKGDAASWLEVMEAAHEVGLMTTGTMMFGITESFAERVEHLRVLRDQQDRTHHQGWTGRYSAFAAWPFQSSNTPWEGKLLKPNDAEYLRTIAIARIYLDNFQHIQSSWVTMGRKTGQLALHHGCDDMGSLMIEENVVSSAGTCHSVNRMEMIRMIETAGFVPWQRDNIYRPVEPGALTN